VTFSASLFSSPTGVDQVASAMAARVLGTNLASQPAASTVTNELGTLINTLCQSSACNSLPRVQAVATAACAAAFGSSDMLIN
jgi:hypothetical protein